MMHACRSPCSPSGTATCVLPSGGPHRRCAARAAADRFARRCRPRSPRPVRDVTPAQHDRPARRHGPAGAHRAAASAAPPAPPPKLPTARLNRPIVIDGRHAQVRGREIRLAGIAAPDFEERCGEGAAAWPCGRMARAALAPLHPRPRHRMRDAGGRRRDPRPGRLRGRRRRHLGSGWSRRAGRSAAATRFAERGEEARARRSSACGATARPSGQPDAVADGAAERARPRAPCRSARASPECRRSPRRSRSAVRAPGRCSSS